jgi:hypothetical protein
MTSIKRGAAKRPSVKACSTWVVGICVAGSLHEIYVMSLPLVHHLFSHMTSSCCRHVSRASRHQTNPKPHTSRSLQALDVMTRPPATTHPLHTQATSPVQQKPQPPQPQFTPFHSLSFVFLFLPNSTSLFTPPQCRNNSKSRPRPRTLGMLSFLSRVRREVWIYCWSNETIGWLVGR